MNKIILSLIFVFIALMGTCCVCASDVNNETLGQALVDDGCLSVDNVKTSSGTLNADDLQMQVDDAQEKLINLDLMNDYKSNATVKVDRDLTINGNGHTIDAGKMNSPIFESDCAHITLKNLNLVNCKNSAVHVFGYGQLTLDNCTIVNCEADNGGAVNSDVSSKLTIQNSVFKNNKAKHMGGAVWSKSPVNIINTTFESNNAKEFGGAVYTKENVNIYNSTLIKNQATLSGGAVYGYRNIIVDASLFDSNKAMVKNKYDNNGGAIYCDGNVTVSQSVFNKNRADDYGGAVYATGSIFVNPQNNAESSFSENEAHGGCGGALFAGENIIINNAALNKNHAKLDGGAAYAKNGSINASYSQFNNNKATGKDKYQNSGGVLFSQKSMQITNCILNNNKADDYGGAIYCKDSVKLENCQLCGNKASDNDGGAVYAAGDVWAYKSTFKDNWADSYGGAIYCNNSNITFSTFTGNKADDNDGGAIYAKGSLFIYGSEFNKNKAAKKGGAVVAKGKMTLWECKFESNKVENIVENLVGSDYAGEGGAAYGYDDITILNCAMYNNYALEKGGAIYCKKTVTVDTSYKNGQSTFNKNHCYRDTGTQGGAIWAKGDVVVKFAHFKNNYATDKGASIYTKGNLTLHEVTNEVTTGDSVKPYYYKGHKIEE